MHFFFETILHIITQVRLHHMGKMQNYRCFSVCLLLTSKNQQANKKVWHHHTAETPSIVQGAKVHMQKRPCELRVTVRKSARRLQE